MGITINTSDIELGAGVLWVKPWGTSEKWRFMGAAQGGTINNAPEFLKVEADTFLHPVKPIMTGSETTFELSLIEHTAKKWAITAGKDHTDVTSGVSLDSFQGGDTDSSPVTSPSSSGTFDIITVGEYHKPNYWHLIYETPQLDTLSTATEKWDIFLGFKVQMESEFTLEFADDSETVYTCTGTGYPHDGTTNYTSYTNKVALFGRHT